MQEEVSSKTVNLAISTTKLTARTIWRAFRWYLMHRSQTRLRKQMRHPYEEGKQSVGDLMKSGVSTDKIELPDGSAKDFCKIAKKYGVDYAIRKDKTQDPPRYIIFFKAKDTEVLDQIVKDYMSVTDKKNEKKSVREQLKQEKAAARAEAKERAKEKSKDKKQHKKKRKERVEGR